MFRSEAAVLADLKHFAIFPLPARQPPPRAAAQLVPGGWLFSRVRAKEAADRRSPARLPVRARGIAPAMLRRAAGRRSSAA
jgi:hypothetical protein